MTPKKFQTWSESELTGAIKTLEEALASGVMSASYPGGGSVSYVTRDRMEDTLGDLYSALSFVQTGQTPTRIRRVVHVSRKGL